MLIFIHKEWKNYIEKKLLGALLLLCLTLPAWSADFVELNRDEDYIVYIDVESIEMRKQLNNEYLVVWSKCIFRGEVAKKATKAYAQPVDYAMTYYALNVKFKQLQVLSTSIYNKKMKVIDEYPRAFQASNYSEIIPNSIGEAIYNYVINYYKKNNEKYPPFSFSLKY